MRYTSLPKNFLLLGKKFAFDGVFTWYGMFEEFNLLVSIMETDESTLYESATLDRTIYIFTLYHFDELISQGQGYTPLEAAFNAKIHKYIVSLDSMTSFIKTLSSK